MSAVPETIELTDDGYTVPVIEVLTGRAFLTGKSGSGKSNTASVIAEELLEYNLPLLIVDTDGEYWGLKEQYDLVHVGADAEECDRAVELSDAAEIADMALLDDVPVILDVSSFHDEDVTRELIEEVVSRLFIQEKDAKRPFLLIVEEIHEFLPESGGSDDLADMLIRIAKRGRKRGLGLCGISQRPASVDKDFITQCDWLVWHRLTWSNDIKVVREIMGSEVANQVDDLADGEAFVMTDWDEEIRRLRFRRKRTFDAGATPGLEDLARADSAGSTSGGEQRPAGDSAGALRRKENRIAELEQTVSSLEASLAERSDPAAEDGSADPPDDDGGATPAPNGGSPTSSFDPLAEFSHLMLFVFGGLARGVLGIISGFLRAILGLLRASRRGVRGGIHAIGRWVDRSVDRARRVRGSLGRDLDRASARFGGGGYAGGHAVGLEAALVGLLVLAVLAIALVVLG